MGEVILDILLIKKEKLQREFQNNPTKKDEFERAKSDYENFQNSFEDTKDKVVVELSAEDKIKIKSQYRQASKLCHPDIVSDELKEEAEKVFKELNYAYNVNDLDKVTELLENLKRGIFIAKSNSFSELEKLQMQLDKLIMKKENLKNLISNIKDTETFRTIEKLTDWDYYFRELKKQLFLELKRLKSNE